MYLAQIRWCVSDHGTADAAGAGVRPARRSRRGRRGAGLLPLELVFCPTLAIFYVMTRSARNIDKETQLRYGSFRYRQWTKRNSSTAKGLRNAPLSTLKLIR